MRVSPNHNVQIKFYLLFILADAHLKEVTSTLYVFVQQGDFVVLDVVDSHIHFISYKNIGQGFRIKIWDWNNLFNILIISWILYFFSDIFDASVKELYIVHATPNSTNKFVYFIFKEAWNITALEIEFVFVFYEEEGLIISPKIYSSRSSKTKFT